MSDEQALVPYEGPAEGEKKKGHARGRKPGVTDFQTSVLAARAFAYEKSGLDAPAIAHIMGRGLSTVQRWLKPFHEATYAEVMARQVKNMVAYDILHWTWQTRADILAEKIAEYAKWGIVEGDTETPLWELKASFEVAVSYANRYKQTNESQMLIAGRALAAKETQTGFQTLPPQLDFPGIESWYAMIRSYRRVTPRLREDGMDEPPMTDDELDAEIDEFEARYGRVQLPKETM